VIPSRPSASEIVLTRAQARWMQRTLREAADRTDDRREPRHLHHDLNYHAVWLQRRLDLAASHLPDSKEQQL
jgi:hypothetical protein